jgi:hypothetical protein
MIRFTPASTSAFFLSVVLLIAFVVISLFGKGLIQINSSPGNRESQQVETTSPKSPLNKQEEQGARDR